MSVLPQLERALAEACEREAARGPRRWRAWRPGWPLRRPGLGSTAVVLASVIAAVVAVGALVVLRNRAVHHVRASAGPPAPFTRGGALKHGGQIDSAYVTGGSLYVVRQAGSGSANEYLERVDPATGRVLAWVTATTARIDQVLLVDGRLWVTATSNSRPPSRSWLTIHDPRTLARVATVRLQPAGETSFGMGSMARAGRSVWVGDASGIDRFDAATATLEHRVPIRNTQGAEVASSSSGDMLVVDVGSEGATTIERRDPRTGALLARSGPLWAVSKPWIGGVIGGNVWVSAATGMHGYYGRLDVSTLRAEIVAPTRHEVTNGIEVHVLDGILFVSQPFAGPALNYCADPVTGRRRTSLRLPHTAGLLTADSGFVYYVAGNNFGLLGRAPIPVRCRG